MSNCEHNKVEVYRRMVSVATLEEPAEHIEFGVCKDCGKILDLSDIPNEAEITEGDTYPSLRGMPSEFYD
jgi:hypothetical protein